MTKRRRYGTKNAPVMISDTDDEMGLLDDTTPIIDLTDDDQTAHIAHKHIHQELFTQKSLPVRRKSTTTTLSDREIVTGSVRPSNSRNRGLSKLSSSRLPKLGKKVKSFRRTPLISQISDESSSSGYPLLRGKTPSIQRTSSNLREALANCALNCSVPGKENRHSQSLLAKGTQEALPLRKDSRLPTNNSLSQRKTLHPEDDLQRKLHNDSPAGASKRKSLFCESPQQAVRTGLVHSTTSNACDYSITSRAKDRFAAKHKGDKIQETSPSAALVKAKSVVSEKLESLGTPTSISITETEQILREEMVFMQNAHSRLVRNHLRDALVRRNECHQKLRGFCDNEDLFANMKGILVNNKSAYKPKHKPPTNELTKKTAIVVLPHETSNRRVPKYKHYTPIKQNILVPDTRYLAFDPYLGDVEGDKEIKARNKWLKNYRKQFEINEDNESEKKTWLYEYLSRILGRLGLHQDAIMSFSILKDFDAPKCTTASRKTKNIEVFINAFRNVFKKEVQDIMPGVVEHTETSKVSQNCQAAPNEAHHSMKLLKAYMTECPICHMFACAIHGDYEINDNDDEESESDKSETQDEFISDDTSEELLDSDNSETQDEFTGGDVSDELLDPDSNDGFDSFLKNPSQCIEKEEMKKDVRPQPLFTDLNATLEGTLARWDSGVARPATYGETKKQEENKPCSAHCFLRFECNHTEVLDWKEEDLEMLRILIRGIEHDRRAACVLAPVFGKHCYLVQRFISFFVARQEDSRKNAQRDTRAQSGGPKQKYWYDTVRKKIRKDVDLDTVTNAQYSMKCRQPMGCDHVGFLCTEAGDRCDCLTDKIPCDKFCACSEDCSMKFKGCNCSRLGRPCYANTSRCTCVKLSRECDPDLCHGCGAAETANPFTRDVEPSANSCSNTEIQRGVGKRLFVGESSHPDDIGFGAFLAEPVKEEEFIAEYVGEVISAKEADVRWQLYEQLGLSYLFDLNKERQVDSYRYGNKTRFINHGKKRANCYPKAKLVNGEHRIAFYAKKNLAAGVELFFDYGKQFIESHGLKDEESSEDEEDVRPPPQKVPPVVPEYDTDEYEEERPAKRAKVRDKLRKVASRYVL